MDDPDPIILAAALERPAALSGLNDETRGHVVQCYVQLNHASKLLAIEEIEEACEVVTAATNLAIGDVRANVGIEPAAFEDWFATADGSEE